MPTATASFFPPLKVLFQLGRQYSSFFVVFSCGTIFKGPVSLRARLQMTKLHHKLGFINFIITSEVIIKVPLAEAILAEPLLAKTVPCVLAEARLQPVKVVHQGLHHLVLHQLSSRRLDCCRVPFPYSSTSAHTRAERLYGVESRKKIVVVVTEVFWFSVHVVGEVVFIDTVPLCSVAHFRPVTLETGWFETILILDFLNFQNLMKYISCNIVIYRATRWDRLIHFVISNFLSRFHKVWRFVSCERYVNIWRWHHIVLIKMLCEAL